MSLFWRGLTLLVVLPCLAQSPITIIPHPPRPEESPTIIRPQEVPTITLRPTPAARRKEMLDSLGKEFVELDQLTAELKAAVIQSSTEKLSVDVLRKTEQLEKIARKIRNTYKQAY